MSGRSRASRGRRTRGRSRVGERFEATVGPVAHGGHCVVRLDAPDSRVVFTRHGVPGERVVVEITEGSEGDRFWRGDVVEVIDASRDRVAPPCPHAGPGLCGGCDFQHVDVDAQRGLKTTVVREQLVRLGGLAADDPRVTSLEVEAVPVPGRPDDGLRWRTRQRYARTDDGAPAMRRHRSRQLVVLDDCLIATEQARPAPLPHQAPAGRHGERSPGRPQSMTSEREVVAAGRRHRFDVDRDGFWQVHPEAPRVLVETVLEMVSPREGESVLDLYAGVGLFARFLADAVGEQAPIVAVEGDRSAARHARANLAGLAATVVAGGVAEALAGDTVPESVDLVVLDPPREGARRVVVEQVAARAPRAAAYVACDPAALARDVAIFAEHGYELTAVRAFDLFPMTSHTECVALLAPATDC